MQSQEDFRRGRHVVYRLSAHLVFTPKYRRRVLTSRVMKLLKKVFVSVCEDFECVLREMGHEGDHVHLLIDYPPHVSLSKLINSLKGVSARRIRAVGYSEVDRALWGRHFWSPSYCAVSCGGAPLDVVAAYVQNQTGRSSPA